MRAFRLSLGAVVVALLMLPLAFGACIKPMKTEAVAPPKKTETPLTKEQKEFCINTFKLYQTKCDKNTLEERIACFKLISMYDYTIDENGDTVYSIDPKQARESYLAIIAHIDSVITHCIDLVERGENKKTLRLLETECMNIYGHYNNNVYNEWDLHSVMALLYSLEIEDDKEYWSKLVPLGEWTRIHIQAVTAENHSNLYKQVLSELIMVYEKVGNESKKAEIEKLYAEFESKN